MKKKIYIYGAGKFGVAMLRFLESNLGNIVTAFIETTSPEGKIVGGIPVFSIDSLYGNSDALIILAINNEAIRRSICTKLVSHGVPLKHIVTAVEFLKGNNLLEEDKKYCLLCSSYVDGFLADGISADIFLQYHIIGGGYRENNLCPLCGASDRERWVYYVLCNFTHIFDAPCSVLHFAPESTILRNIMQANRDCHYFSADIAPGHGMYQVDMTDIRFGNEAFDYVIANHVLEHIVDDGKAIRELKRMLKPNGAIILSFPICPDRDTYEDFSIQSPEARLKAYGQEDHVRLYGRDYRERIERYGLNVSIYTPLEQCDEETIGRFGFIKDDVVMMCTK